MGAQASKPTIEEIQQVTKKIINNPLKMERIIAGNCDFLPESQERNIRIGIATNHEDPSNPLGRQVIKIGDQGPFRLHAFSSSPDQIMYAFEKNVHLTIMKRRGSVLYNLKTDELDITREIDEPIRKMFKTMDLDSQELDKIKEYMQ
jgi:hypothetical protein